MKHYLWKMGLFLTMGTNAWAGGFQVALQGQRQIGMAHTGTALAFDASSIFFNPGSLAFTTKNNVTLGASIIRSRVQYLSPQDNGAYSNYTAMTESPLGTPFSFYASWGAEESDVKFGLGVYTPFGSSVKWASDWKGYSVLQELSLQSIFIQPTASFKFGDMGFGIGLVYAIGSVDLKRGIGALSMQDGFGSAQLKGNATGWGLNLGYHLQASEQWSFGASFRSRVDMNVKDGDASFKVPSSAIALGRFPEGGKTNFDATLPLPTTASFGIGYKMDDRWTFALDYNMVYWSAYSELRFNYKQPVNGSLTSVSPRRYKDASIIRIGAEFMATDALALRAGYYYDQTPVGDGYMTPETPDANRNCFTAGIGYKFSDRFSADASFLFAEGVEREQKQEDIDAHSQKSVASGGSPTQDSFLAGTYKLRVMVPGFSLSYKF